MDKNRPCMILACGGTGGHIFPAFSVAHQLACERPDLRIIYVCGAKDIENEIFKLVEGQPVERVESAAYRGVKSFINPKFLIKLLSGFIKSIKIIQKYKPKLVAGFGGHTCFSVVMAAKLCGVKTLIHEQNAVPGTANKVLARWVDKIALTYPNSLEYFQAMKSRCVVTGNPIRASIEADHRAEAYSFFRFDPAKKTLLVLGGSQGAESINQVFLQSLDRLSDSEKNSLQVLHLCGKMNVEDSTAVYRQFGVEACVFSFFSRMELAYAITDIAIGRAGATFLAEVEALGIPALLIPYPFAGGHQKANAHAYAAKNKAIILMQEDMTLESFTQSMKTLLSLPARVKDPAIRAKGSTPSARKKLCAVMVESLS